jgi:hypothetical protein
VQRALHRLRTRGFLIVGRLGQTIGGQYFVVRVGVRVGKSDHAIARAGKRCSRFRKCHPFGIGVRPGLVESRHHHEQRHANRAGYRRCSATTRRRVRAGKRVEKSRDGSIRKPGHDAIVGLG